MTAIRRQTRELERLERRAVVIPPSLIRVFEILAAIDAGSTDARGRHTGQLIAPRQPQRATLTQDAL
jgi:hypothetical protein